MPRKRSNTVGTILVTLGVTVALTISVLAMLPALVRADRVRLHLVEAVRAATGRDLEIGGKVTVSLFPSLSVLVTDVSLASPPGFTSPHLVRAAALEAELRLLPLMSGRTEFRSFQVVDPTVTLEVDRHGHPNWTAPGQAAGMLPGLRSGETRLVNGSVTYVDERSGFRESVERIDLTAQLGGRNAPLAAQGSLWWHGRPSAMTFHLADPQALAEGKSSPVHLILAPGTSEGDGQLSIAGLLTAPDDGLALSGARIELSGMTATGDLAITASGSRPRVKGSLTVDSLDLTDGLPADGNASVAAPALLATDGDLTVIFGSVALGQLRTGTGALSLTLHDGQLAADLHHLELYGGNARGRLTVDASQTSPQADVRLAFDGVRVEPLLAAAALDHLQGIASGRLHLSAHGTSRRELVASLAGQGSAVLRDGESGLDWARLMRDGTLPKDGVPETTAFTELAADWTVAEGVVTSRALTLKAPGLRVAASGTIDLAQRSLVGRLVAVDAAGPAVPVVVEGPWNAPRVRADPTALAAADKTHTGKRPALIPAPRPVDRRAAGGGGR